MLCNDLERSHAGGIGIEFQDGENIYTHRHIRTADSCCCGAETNTDFVK